MPSLIEKRNSIINTYHNRKKMMENKIAAGDTQTAHEMGHNLDGMVEVFTNIFGEDLRTAKIR